MKNISDIDKNFQIDTSIDLKGRKVLNVLDEPFEIYGVIKPDKKENYFKRVPESIAKTVSENVLMLSANTAGGRVRFATDSKTFGVVAQINGVGRMPHMPLSGTCGFDCFTIEGEKYIFKNSYISLMENGEKFECIHWVDYDGMKDVEFNFPLYSGVKNMYIVLDDFAKVEKTKSRYKDIAPVLYYGSSITQGGCATRPGTSYQSVIERMTNVDYVNLGFSGSALAEDAIAQYIKNLPMSVFVYDYDHNAGPERLEVTHEKMFKTIRKANPELPIICVSMPFETYPTENEKRRQIIRRTVDNAIKNGDKNVYFIDGREFANRFDTVNEFTVDGCHPNDLGFMCMARVIGEKIKEILFL